MMQLEERWTVPPRQEPREPEKKEVFHVGVTLPTATADMLRELAEEEGSKAAAMRRIVNEWLKMHRLELWATENLKRIAKEIGC